jgi:hypothetical protein
MVIPMSMKILLSFAALAVAVGCGPSFKAATPDTFVELDNDYDLYDYRATTAEGLVMAVREIDNDAKGKTDFWLTAIKNSMRDRGGYALLDTKAVKSADGVEGTQLRFGHDENGGKPHLYYLTIFVTEKTIWLVEAGGTKELMEANAKKVDEAVSSFSTN